MATDAAYKEVQHVPIRERKIVGRWLLGCAGMCFGAVVIGGITRYFVMYSFVLFLFCVSHSLFNLYNLVTEV
jgi:hypothetical protein